MRMRIDRLLSVQLVLSVAAAAWFGCTTTEQTTSAKASGFLGDYSQLHAGADGEAQLVYLDESTAFSVYDSVLLDDVTFWVVDGDHGETVDPETQQRMTDRLYHAVYSRLAEDYRMVAEPGPGVLRIRAAITEAKGARVVGNAITTTVPQLRLLAKLGDLDRDTAVFVGQAAVECEILDSTSGKRLAAAVDERMGAKTLRNAFTKWGDVDDSLDYWADRLGDRLAKLRTGDASPLEE